MSTAGRCARRRGLSTGSEPHPGLNFLIICFICPAETYGGGVIDKRQRAVAFSVIKPGDADAPTQNVPLRKTGLYRNLSAQVVSAGYAAIQFSRSGNFVSHYPLDSIRREAGGRRLYCCRGFGLLLNKQMAIVT